MQRNAKETSDSSLKVTASQLATAVLQHCREARPIIFTQNVQNSLPKMAEEKIFDPRKNATQFLNFRKKDSSE